jgi:NTE family protein
MKYKFGVSLSGGGYRAAAFHLGTLRFLHKAGILKKVECFSTVSGGSIIGAAYCLRIDELKTFEKFEVFIKMNLQKSIIRRVLFSLPFLRLVLLSFLTLSTIVYFTFFTLSPWVGFVILFMGFGLLIKFQFKLFPVSEIIEDIYNRMFYEKAVLTDLPANPVLVINSTNLQSGRLFYFTRDNISDSTYDNTYEGSQKKVFKHDKFPVAKAVMSSSCVPSFFTPIAIEKDLLIDPEKNIRPVLVDGGIYDNQGIHKLTHKDGMFECNTVIVSDAGNLLPFEGSYNNILTLLLRTVEVFMNSIKMFQMMTNLYQNKSGNGREIAYVTLGWDIDNLISGFVKNLRNGNVIKSVRDVHKLTDDFIAKHDDGQISDHMKMRINFEAIKSNAASSEQIKIARLVSTNLTALSTSQIDALSLHAETMTEIQTKLYCPAIFE